MCDRLTEAVGYAVAAADNLVRVYGNWGPIPSPPDHFRGTLESLDKWLQESSALVDIAKRFRGLWNSASVSDGGISAPSYHELGRTVAMSILDGIYLAANLAECKRGGGMHICAPDCARSCPGRAFKIVARNWPAVHAYLRDQAPKFDSHVLIASIQGEAAAARRQAKEDPAWPAKESIASVDACPPDHALVMKMKGNSRALLCYMWSRGNVSRDELRTVLHEHRLTRDPEAKPPSNKAVDDAVGYLERRLSEERMTHTRIVKNGGMYCLKHPQK